MKRILILLTAALVLFTGCAEKQTITPEDSTEKQLTIVTSFYPVYIMTLNIVKDIPGIGIYNLVRPTTGCLHDYQLTPEDLITLEKAQIFIINGAGMESFLDKVTQQLPELKVVDAGQGLAVITDQSGEPNPHLWVSVENAMRQVQNIAGQLALQDPENAESFRKNAEVYIGKLTKLRDKMHRELDSITNRNIITFHEAFPYFAKEFQLNIAAVIEREPGSAPSAAELADTIQIIKKKDVQAIFAEPQYPANAARTIAGETGIKIYTLDPAVTGPLDPDAYVNIMEENLQTLAAALK